MTTKSITLEIWQPNDMRIQVNQGEVNSRFLEIKILDKNKSFNLADKTVIFYATKPDGNLIFNYCEVQDAQKGIITLAMTSQMPIVPGIMRDCEIDIIDAGVTKLKVKGLSIEIVRCTDFESAVESISEFTALDETLADVQKVMDAYSEENIMEKIMSMDGEGSGLDADLLDGKHGEEYATAEQGKKADTAIQKIKGNGVEIPMSADKVVNITPTDIDAVPTTRRINDKPLSSDITLTPQNIGAAAENHGNHVPAPQTASANVFLRNDNSWQQVAPQDIGAATKKQGEKADTALQGVRVNGEVIPARSDGVVDITISDTGNAVLGIKGNGSMISKDKNNVVNITPHIIGAVPVTRKINGKSLADDVTITLEDFGGATAEQGQKADSAIQGVKVNGTLVNPDSARIVDIDATSIGGATAEQGQKADSAIQGVKLNGTLIEPDSQNTVNLEINETTVNTYTATINTEWTTAETGEYTQTVVVDGILEIDNPIVDVILGDSKDVALQQLEAWSCVSKIKTSDGNVTVICFEEVPTVAIPIQLKVVR